MLVVRNNSNVNYNFRREYRNLSNSKRTLRMCRSSDTSRGTVSSTLYRVLVCLTLLEIVLSESERRARISEPTRTHPEGTEGSEERGEHEQKYRGNQCDSIDSNTGTCAPTDTPHPQRQKQKQRQMESSCPADAPKGDACAQEAARAPPLREQRASLLARIEYPPVRRDSSIVDHMHGDSVPH